MTVRPSVVTTRAGIGGADEMIFTPTLPSTVNDATMTATSAIHRRL
jgi:hypothetical protein